MLHVLVLQVDVDLSLGGDVGELGLPPNLHLFSHGLEVPLHAIDPDMCARRLSSGVML